jgi:hypothetical protein
MATAANADLTYHVDPRLPIGDNLKKSDPTHPGNIVKKLLETGNQAKTDSYYDNQPKRLPRGVTESFVSFESVITNPTQTAQIYVVAAILGIILSLVFVTRENPLLVKIALVFVLVVCTHYLVARLEKYTV